MTADNSRALSDVMNMGEKKETTLPTNHAGSVTVEVRGKKYHVYSSAPMAMMQVDDLLKALEHNRAVLKRCQEEMRRAFELEALRYEHPSKINYDTPTQDAIQAHLNINMLIPLINLKGGRASFEKPETLNVQERVNMMRNIAERTVFMERMQNFPNPYNASVIITLVLLVLLAVVTA